MRAQKELILLHREDADTPKGTVEWLNARGWCTSHHHIRCHKRVFSKKSQAKQVGLFYWSQVQLLNYKCISFKFIIGLIHQKTGKTSN